MSSRLGEQLSPPLHVLDTIPHQRVAETLGGVAVSAEDTLGIPEWEQIQSDMMAALPMLDHITKKEYMMTFRRPLEDGSMSEEFEVSAFNMNHGDNKNLAAYLGFWKIKSPGKPDAMLAADPVGGTSFSLTRRIVQPDGRMAVEDVPVDEFADRAATLRHITEKVDYVPAFAAAKKQLESSNKAQGLTASGHKRRFGRVLMAKSRR